MMKKESNKKAVYHSLGYSLQVKISHTCSLHYSEAVCSDHVPLLNHMFCHKLV